MKFYLLFLFIFIAELTLDSSTSFVRSHAPVKQSASGEKVNIVPAHAATLPPLFASSQYWIAKVKPSFADIVMPYLNPPISTIDRPPIC